MTLDVLTVKQVSRKLGIGINQTYEACEQNLFPCVRFGRRWIISRTAFDKWLSECGFENKEDSSRVESHGDEGAV